VLQNGLKARKTILMADSHETRNCFCFVDFIKVFISFFVTVFCNCILRLLSSDVQYTHRSSKYKEFGKTVNLSRTILWFYFVKLLFRIYFTNQSNDK
jgi:hypothetical protein